MLASIGTGRPALLGALLMAAILFAVAAGLGARQQMPRGSGIDPPRREPVASARGRAAGRPADRLHHARNQHSVRAPYRRPPGALSALTARPQRRGLAADRLALHRAVQRAALQTGDPRLSRINCPPWTSILAHCRCGRTRPRCLVSQRPRLRSARAAVHWGGRHGPIHPDDDAQGADHALVMILMIAILIFGLWDILHVVKRG